MEDEPTLEQQIYALTSEINFLQKQVKERDLRIQLYQFSFDKIEELKKHIESDQNLYQIWVEFEIFYKVITGTNLIKFTDTDHYIKVYEEKLNQLLKPSNNEEM
ncbi:MAG: hypothetical protein HC836_33070 [Richelia sp. RM2_1_2]|nr:hypothetical protein [Richelia sp. RM2_1_2]